MVGLEAVTARFVEQHAAGAVLDDDGHRARRRRAGPELGDRLAGRLAGELFHVDGVEDLEPDGVPHRLVAGLHAGVAVGDGADPHERAHDLVVGEHAVGVGHEHPFGAVAVAGRHLHDLRAEGTGSFVHALQEFHLRQLRHRVGILLDRVRAVRRRAGECNRAHATSSTTGGSCGRRGRRGEARLGQVRGVREPGGLPGDDPDPRATVAAAGDLLDASVVETGRRGSLVLGVHLGEVGAGTHGAGKYSFQDVGLDHPIDSTAMSLGATGARPDSSHRAVETRSR